MLAGRLAGPDAKVSVSVAEIQRVLGNVIGNALRETPPGGAVCVETGTAADGSYVSVRDECGGIPEEDLPRLFDPAYRGSLARPPATGAGAGLGLAIARGLLEAHGGTITARNTDVGCEFTLRLLPQTPGQLAPSAQGPIQTRRFR